ncbi:MAG TPA: DegV family protein [Candidatus Binatia bacterium]|nr:DegV family protein [Candidatus Binatia bacterium]
MGRVAIVIDSASDMDPGRAASLGITVVPLLVTFGNDTFEAGVNLSTDEFWKRMTAPDAPFPKTAACSPGSFQQIYQRLYDEGAEGIVSVHVADTLSGTIKAAQVAKASMPDRDIQIVDSMSASMGEGVLAEIGVRMAADGATPTQIAETLTRRRDDINVYLALETLEYLKRGGRISGARAAIGTLLSVKPIIEVKQGVVDTADRVRTRGKARERLIELLTARPIERLAVLHTTNAGVEEFTDELVARAGIDRSAVTVDVVGPSVGPHVGPGCDSVPSGPRNGPFIR